jgi:hypothetical protein
MNTSQPPRDASSSPNYARSNSPFSGSGLMGSSMGSGQDADNPFLSNPQANPRPSLFASEPSQSQDGSSSRRRPNPRSKALRIC